MGVEGVERQEVEVTAQGTSVPPYGWGWGETGGRAQMGKTGGVAQESFASLPTVDEGRG